MKGEIFYATAEEEECMGSARYSGLKDKCEFPANMQIGAFLVPMGVYKNIPAVQRSWKNNPNIEPGIFNAVIFAPLNRAEFEPDVIFVVCNANQGWKYFMQMHTIPVHRDWVLIQAQYAVQWLQFHI